MDHLGYDLRHAARWLVKNRRVTLLAVVTVALGIGLNAAVFSVVNGVVLRPLSFAEPARLVCLWMSPAEGGRQRLALPDAHDLSERCRSFSGLAYYLSGTYEVSGEHFAEELPTVAVSIDALETLGLRPALGRDLRPGDELAEAEQVVILGHELWQRRFDADPGVLGAVLTVRGVRRTIVGVLPEHAGLLPTVDGGAQRFQVWVPFEPRPGVPRSFGLVHAAARIGAEVTLHQARVEVETVARQLELEHPDTNRGRRFVVVPIEQQILGSLGAGLLLLLGAVVFVVLIAVTNVANLLLAVGADRRREIAIRRAVGAAKGQILRRLLLETLLLGLFGGAAGVLASVGGLSVLVVMAPPGIPRLDEVGIDARVLLYSAVMSVLAGLAMGLAPALHHLRRPLRTALDDRSGVTHAGGDGRLFAELVVVGQIALAVVLLVGAVVMARSLGKLLAVEPGFEADKLLAVRMRLPADARGEVLVRQLGERIEALPGVEAFGTIGYLPFDHAGWEISYSTDADGAGSIPGEGHSSFVQTVTPGYFRAMGILLLAGRSFGHEDLVDGSKSIIVSASLANEGWPGGEPLGRKATLGIFDDREPRLVVGVVADVRQRSLEGPPPPTLYMAGTRQGHFATYGVVRAAGDPKTLAGAVRSAIHDVDPRVVILETAPVGNMVLASAARPRFVRWLLAVLSGLATALALVGIYGVMSWAAARRLREMGVRLSLGATPRAIVRLLLQRGLRLAAAGVLLGVLAALVLTRGLVGLLHEVSARDPLSFAAAALLLLAASVLACLPPALRAASTDPMVTMRDE